MSLPLAPQTALQALHFPACPRGTRVVFILLKQFSSKLETEAEAILTLLIKLIGGETDASEPRPAWVDEGARDGDGKAPLYTSFLVHWLIGGHAMLYPYICVQAL